MESPFSLKNKTILITGASSGIGRAAAIECSKMGAIIIALGRNEMRLKETLSLLSSGDHKIALLDINNLNEVNSFIESIETIDSFVNSAGIINTQLFNFLKEESLKDIMQTNFFSPVLFLQKLIKKKKIVNGGSIVFISSIGGSEITSLGLSSYAASKSAINGISKTLALELSSKRIRVNNILPGMVQTELLDHTAFSEEDFNKDQAKYPLGYGQPNDVAYAVIYLLSNASKWITGTNLKLDGGFTLR
jgi:NAD(P)-dependent dehydrogenase (short-subunit alcohol dehydrogenase family)